jgi:hypothetical protein
METTEFRMKPRECLFCGITFTPPAEDGQMRYCGERCRQEAELALRAFALLLQHSIPISTFRAWVADRLVREWLRQLIWRQGDLEFMVCEDYTFADVHSRQVYLSAAPVQLVQPISAAWRSVFYDYKTFELALTSGGASHFRKLRYVPLLEQAVHSEYVSVRYALIENPHTPPAVLRHLAQDPVADIRQTLAESPFTPSDVLTLLAQDPVWQVRAAVAWWGWTVPPLHLCTSTRLPPANTPHINVTIRQAPRIFAELLAHLAQDPIKEVRDMVAANAYALPATYTHLAHDVEPTVRVTLALNSATPPAVLQYLAGDEIEWVRFTVASNRHTPLVALRQLAHDPVEHIQRAAQESIAAWQQVGKA